MFKKTRTFTTSCLKKFTLIFNIHVTSANVDQVSQFSKLLNSERISKNQMSKQVTVDYKHQLAEQQDQTVHTAVQSTWREYRCSQCHQQSRSDDEGQSHTSHPTASAHQQTSHITRTSQGEHRSFHWGPRLKDGRPTTGMRILRRGHQPPPH